MKDGAGPPQLVASDSLVHWRTAVSASADWIANWLGRQKYLILFLFSSLYLLTTCYRAYRKLFWFDELFTVYISRMPDMASVWSALKQGVDLNPPLFYGLIRVSESLLGEGHIGTRLPSIIGFLICCLCLFRFVSVRTSVLGGFISMLFPLVTTAYFYAYEARPHGIVFGFGGLALLCWQEAARSTHRNYWLIGLFATLVCAMLTHTYAILLIVPFALAEFVRAVLIRRVDWIAWLAIIASVSGMLASLPLFQAAKADIPALFPATGLGIMKAYQSHLTPAIGVFAAALILYFIFIYTSPNPPAAPNRTASSELPEMVVLIAFLAMPVFTFIVARLTGAPFFYRYSITAVIGFGCLLGIVTAKRAPVAVGLFFFLIAQIGVNFFEYARSVTLAESSGNELSIRAKTFDERYAALEAVPGKNAPILLLDYMDFLPMMHYAPAEMTPRLVYLLDPGHDFIGEGYRRLQRHSDAPGRLVTLEEVVSTYDTFTAYCSSRSIFRLDHFIREGAEVTAVGTTSDNLIFTVSFKKKRSDTDPK